jgi:bifunctional non-homologous end joining protein LigD
MSLSVYKKKRNFKDTPEPGGTAGKKSATRSFVIQRHKASRLHYDLRLEADGVLKSWAIPRGPSLNPTDKRLSVMVEDHPIAYGSFKGNIPEGNYGAGIVEIWDKGTYVPEEMEKISDRAIVKAIDAGMLKFNLKGKKLKGSFALVRIDGKNWLLIKHRDRYATESEYNSEEHTLKSSAINKALIAEGKLKPAGSRGGSTSKDKIPTGKKKSSSTSKDTTKKKKVASSGSQASVLPASTKTRTVVKSGPKKKKVASSRSPASKTSASVKPDRAKKSDFKKKRVASPESAAVKTASPAKSGKASKSPRKRK